MGRLSGGEIVWGLVVPVVVIVVLAGLAQRAEVPGVPLAFLAAVPMFAAMFTRALLTGLVAVLTVVDAAVSAAAAYGQEFADAIPLLVGVIIGAGAAVLASQARPVRARPQVVTADPEWTPEPAASEPLLDALTGLPTRAGALAVLADAAMTGPRVVAVIDCDGLAALNDAYGRAIGDTFLFAVAGRTRYALAEGDLVARWDGEEFVVAITGDVESVRPTLALITDKVNKNPIRTDAGLIPASMSVGAAAWPEGVAFADALAGARRALYRAKLDGGACLVID
jgi:diguanylate cyclase (GGDEF)-like protein